MGKRAVYMPFEPWDDLANPSVITISQQRCYDFSIIFRERVKLTRGVFECRLTVLNVNNF